MRRRALQTWQAAALLLLCPGCGDDPAPAVVALENFTFSPAQTDIAVGDTIVFVNHDVVPHTATARDGSWDTGSIGAGDTTRVAVSTAGEYFCAFHPTMTARVSLQER